jgi:hypothetical protein
MADTHILVGTTATLEVTFYADGVPADDGTPTIGITKADGTVLVNPGTATTSGGTGVRRYQLAAQPLPASLTATWTGSTQTMTTRVEIVGALLFTIAQLRDVKVGNGKPFNSTDYPNNVVADRRAEVTEDFEQRTGWSFVPRFTRERFTGDGTSSLIVRQYKPGALLSVTVDGAAQTPLTLFDLTDDGTLTWSTATFPATRPNNVIVEYVRGFDRPPAEISEVALARTAGLLLPAQAGSAASTWTTPEGTSYSFDAAGRSLSGGGRSFYGIPKIDAVLSDPAYNARRGGVFA